jgi:exo-beta-1,3-glucanase (GH17 family)
MGFGLVGALGFALITLMEPDAGIASPSDRVIWNGTASPLAAPVVLPHGAKSSVRIETAVRPDGSSDDPVLLVDMTFHRTDWAGVVFMTRPGAWGQTPETGALDLSAAKTLSFRAKGTAGGERIRIKAAIAGEQPYGDSAALPVDSGWIELDRDWRTVSIELGATDLSRVITPFVLIANRWHNPDRHVVVLLDDIRFKAGQAPFPQAATPDAEDPFIAYLADPRSALIAFNPSRYEPQNPAGIPSDEIRADLQVLAPVFDGLVLYAYETGLTGRVVEMAVALGYRSLLLGVWNPRSTEELEGVAQLIRRYHDRIALAVCIGNEGLDTNRYAFEDLPAAAARLKAMLGDDLAPPITTSEPSADYGYPPVRAFGDFLAPNIHPAFDQAGLEPARAADWVRTRAQMLAKASGRPVLVKETGVPGGGAPGDRAEIQAAFWEAYVHAGRWERLEGDPRHWVSYAAAFEAFNAPWKAAKSGLPIEGYWGLLDVDRRPSPAFAVWQRRPR